MNKIGFAVIGLKKWITLRLKKSSNGNRLLVAGKRPVLARNQAQRAVERALEWGRQNGLEFNSQKTEVVQFKRAKFAKPPRILIDGERIPFSAQVKYLGVELTYNLHWTPHIKKMADKAKGKLFAAKRLVGKNYGA
jgi:hypothetical protein